MLPGGAREDLIYGLDAYSIRLGRSEVLSGSFANSLEDATFYVPLYKNQEPVWLGLLYLKSRYAFDTVEEMREELAVDHSSIGGSDEVPNATLHG